MNIVSLYHKPSMAFIPVLSSAEVCCKEAVYEKLPMSVLDKIYYIGKTGRFSCGEQNNHRNMTLH